MKEKKKAISKILSFSNMFHFSQMLTRETQQKGPRGHRFLVLRKGTYKHQRNKQKTTNNKPHTYKQKKIYSSPNSYKFTDLLISKLGLILPVRFSLQESVSVCNYMCAVEVGTIKTKHVWWVFVNQQCALCQFLGNIWVRFKFSVSHTSNCALLKFVKLSFHKTKYQAGFSNCRLPEQNQFELTYFPLSCTIWSLRTTSASHFPDVQWNSFRLTFPPLTSVPEKSNPPQANKLRMVNTGHDRCWININHITGRIWYTESNFNLKNFSTMEIC